MQFSPKLNLKLVEHFVYSFFFSVTQIRSMHIIWSACVCMCVCLYICVCVCLFICVCISGCCNVVDGAVASASAADAVISVNYCVPLIFTPLLPHSCGTSSLSPSHHQAPHASRTTTQHPPHR